MRLSLIQVILLVCSIAIAFALFLVTPTTTISKTNQTLKYIDPTNPNQTTTRQYIKISKGNIFSYQNSQRPLLILLHGAGEHANIAVQESRLIEFLTDKSVVAIAPDGSGNHPSYLSWNGGSCCSDAQQLGTDDIHFLDELIEDVSIKHKFDTGKIFLIGFSNGAVLAHRYVCEGRHNIAALGAVSGGGSEWSRCPIEHNVPLIKIRELDSRPFNRLSCSHEPQTETLYTSYHQTIRKYSGECDTSPITFYHIEGGVHGWSMIRTDRGRDSLLQTNSTLEILWNDFHNYVQF